MKYLDIEPTSICNLKCPFCFGPKNERNKTEISIGIWKSFLKEFKSLGVGNVVISGGEPLLYDNLFELFHYLKSLNFNVVISTNGRLKDKLFSIAQYCDWISLPIDGISDEISHLMRTDYYTADEILNTAHELKAKNGSLRIKIGTVATKKNIHEIAQIGKVLERNINAFDTWKIYQYTPRRKQKRLQEEHVISNNQFNELSNLLRKYFSQKMRLVISSNQSRSNAYCFVYQNGDVNLVNMGEDFGDLYVGNVKNLDDINFTMIDNILNSNHIANYENTY